MVDKLDEEQTMSSTVDDDDHEMQEENDRNRRKNRDTASSKQQRHRKHQVMDEDVDDDEDYDDDGVTDTKKKTGNHKVDASAVSALPKCICSWKNCRAYQKAFRAASTTLAPPTNSKKQSSTKPHIFDGVIRIKLFKNQEDCEDYRECLDRTLGVTKEPDWKYQHDSNANKNSKGGGNNNTIEPYCKYTIARHHFTEQHMIKYDASVQATAEKNQPPYSFIKPFSYHGAMKYLYKVDPNEVLRKQDDGPDGGSNVVSYFQCPNVPSDVVKLEYRRIIDAIKAQQQNKKSSPQSDDHEEEEEENPPTTKKSEQSKKKVSKSKNHDDDDDDEDQHHDDDDDTAARSEASRIMAEKLVKLKEVENKLLKEQLDAMKSQLTFLHDMVEKLQAQHLDSSASVYSRNSRKSKHSKKSTNTSNLTRKPSTVNKHRSSRRPEYDEEDGSESRGVVDDDDDEEEDEDEEEEDDESDAKSQRTFQSKYKRRPQQRYDDEEEEGSEEEDDSASDDYNDCMSVGASTIMSASRSMKSLPREMEMDENDDSDDDDDDDGHVAGWNSSGHQVNSHHSPCNSSHNSASTFGRATATQSPSQQAFGSRRMSIVSKQNSGTSSTVSNSVSNDHSTARGGKGGNIPPSRGNYNVTSKSSIASSSVGNGTAASGGSGGGGAGEDDTSSGDLYEVTSLAVTDPYGEKGTYSGTISRSTGMPHGYGRLVYDEAGRWYEGDWKHGRWTGFGRLSNGGGDYYEGGVKNDRKHGRGFMKFSDGRTFEGRYFNGQMIHGKMTYEDGSTYDGSWVDNMRHGFGRCTFADDSVYQGEFKEGEFCGNGKMTWNDGGWYEGQWLNGEMHGTGREIRADGSLRHDGEWWRGQPVRQ